MFHLPVDAWSDRNGARIDVERDADGIPFGLRHSGGYYVAVDTAGPRVTSLRLLDQVPDAYTTDASREGGTVVMRYGYDEAGNLIEVINSSDLPLKFTYDTDGRVTQWTDRNGTWFTYTYDERGRVVRTEGADGFLSGALEYEDATHITTYTDSPGHRTTHRHNPEGLVEEETDQLGHTTRHTSAHFDVPATRTEPDGTTYSFAYDTELRLTGVINPQGLTWSYTYDAAGRPVTETDFNGRTLTYTHDGAGGLISRTNGAGEALEFTRDALGRITAQHHDTGDVTTYAYDTAGRMSRAANSDAEVVVERDALGRTLSETVNGRTTASTYDALGRRTRRTAPSGLATEWTYDLSGRPIGLQSEAGTLTFTYDASGREIQRRLGTDLTLSQTWDATDQLTTQSLTAHRTAGADCLLQHRAYAYGPDGCLTEIRELTSGTRRFSLDRTGRTTRVQAHGWTEKYAYDSAGHLTHAVAPAHETPGEREFDGALIRRAGHTTYEHDAQGRRTQMTRKLLNGQRRTWTYVWTAEDRLAEAVTPDGERWLYAYDPLGRRISKHRRCADGSETDRTSFAWDGTCLAEQTGSDGRVTTWDYAPGTHRPLTQTNHHPRAGVPGRSLLAELAENTTNRNATRFHSVVTDAVGTPTELVTPDGDLVWQHRTALWGTDLPAPHDTTAALCPLRFPGQYADAETGLNYNYFRYYDPQTSRYTSPDPLGLDPGPTTHTSMLPLRCSTLWA
ncbi:RHS repeat-associated core domain-containing protein [Streptomyces sp. bgisy031]|uniref:RHS repeat-associated core domain-containing protein n=1 Tax=Streptomyces sp. bgisy031 TaxID=3413772 RepID=UPI003D74C71A